MSPQWVGVFDFNFSNKKGISTKTLLFPPTTPSFPVTTIFILVATCSQLPKNSGTKWTGYNDDSADNRWSDYILQLIQEEHLNDVGKEWEQWLGMWQHAGHSFRRQWNCGLVWNAVHQRVCTLKLHLASRTSLYKLLQSTQVHVFLFLCLIKHWRMSAYGEV